MLGGGANLNKWLWNLLFKGTWEQFDNMWNPESTGHNASKCEDEKIFFVILGQNIIKT